MKRITQLTPSPNVFLLLIMIIVLSACKDDEEVTPPAAEEPYVQPFENAIIPPTTVPLDEASSDALTSLSSDGELVFESSNSQLDTLEVGDVLIIGVTPATPYGALKKVTSISPSGNGFSVQTVQAKITDAYQEVHIQYEQVLGLEDINMDSTFLAEGVTLGSSNGRTQQSGLNLTVDREIEFSENQILTINGSINITPVTTFDLDIEFFELEHMLFKVDITENVEGEFTFSGSYGLEEDYLLARFVGKTVVISGVVITPVFEVELAANGEINVGLIAQFTQQGSLTAGVEYRDNGWETISASPMSVQGGVLSPVANGSVRVGLEPEAKAILYGILGFELEGLSAYMQANVDIVSNPCWSVSTGLGLQPGLEIDSEFFDFEAELIFPFEFTLAGGTLFQGECEVQGSLTGLVKDAVTGEPIANVKVTALNEQREVLSVFSDAEGNYAGSLPEGTYTLVFARDGYLNETMEEVEITGRQIQYLEALLQVGEDYRGTGGVAGTIVDATTGEAIAGAQITFRRGLGNLTGTIEGTATTSANGDYLIDGLEAGNYTTEVTAAGYTTGIMTIISLGGQTTFNQNGSLSPELEAGEIRIVLSWGVTPWDLDSHLTGPTEAGSRFHTYFADMAPVGSAAFLDLDDIFSYGPETITIRETILGLYRYSVHDYTNRDLTGSTAMGQSGAKVQVFIDNVDLGIFNVPNRAGTLWTVFEFTVDENGELDFEAINSMSYESDEDAVQRRLPTDAPLMRNLPKK